MSSPEQTNDTLSLVSSFYGPGNITCWLLTLASVLVTWTLNPKSRLQDAITLDFMAALAVPSVAAGHSFYLLFSPQSLNAELNEEASSVNSTTLFTSSSPKAIRYAAAVEAPLNVCETFSSVAMTMYAIAALNGRSRRASLAMAVGLLAFSTEISIFVQTADVREAITNLARPFLFNSVIAMTVILGVLAFFLVVILVIGLVIIDFRLRRLVVTEETTRKDVEEILNLKVANAQRVERLRMWLSIVPSTCLAPIALLISVLSGTGWIGETTYKAMEPGRARLFFFMPRSTETITELDQAVSLAIGILTLCFSLWDALRVRWQGDISRRGGIDEDLASGQGLTIGTVLATSVTGRELLERGIV
ncbi:hypothetical protein QBC40DRAFT_290941 [Triangularia verruculosa]|uniref:Uncharacterized protein n=1 Tax=Triangularia verruculosa TaxID=2587418 RepID=A0AAN7API4_9PEZI|nr:hypothetical protein QBC40DRAFT_290941 [Triangularia verruculosa]